MARLALAAGARIFSETPVLSIKRQTTTFTLATDKGVVIADHVISATNAYTDKAQPWLKRRLVPVISERSHPGDHKKKYSHWKNIIIHSTEQSNGLFLTELDEITDLEKFLINVSENASCKICFHMSGRKITKNDKSHQSHIILIGPEGGFSTKEIDLIERYNWNIVSLGDRILRTETAAIVAQTILRDF